MKKAPTLRSLLKDLEPGELREVITELCKLTPKNRKFVEIFLHGSDTVDIAGMVLQAKNKIHACFFKSIYRMEGHIDLRGARNVISEHAKLLKDYPRALADLRLFYVETGNEVTTTYGDIDDRFYNSLLSMFDRVLKDLMAHPALYPEFQFRIEETIAKVRHVGWGYYDELQDNWNESKKKLKEMNGIGVASENEKPIRQEP